MFKSLFKVFKKEDIPERKIINQYISNLENIDMLYEQPDSNLTNIAISNLYADNRMLGELYHTLPYNSDIKWKSDIDIRDIFLIPNGTGTRLFNLSSPLDIKYMNNVLGHNIISVKMNINEMAFDFNDDIYKITKKLISIDESNIKKNIKRKMIDKKIDKLKIILIKKYKNVVPLDKMDIIYDLISINDTDEIHYRIHTLKFLDSILYSNTYVTNFQKIILINYAVKEEFNKYYDIIKEILIYNNISIAFIHQDV